MPLFLSMDIPQARSLLRPLCTRLRRGEPAICAYALTEPGAGSDAEDEEGASHARLGVFARPVKGGYILSGRKCFISGGNFARLITVFAATDRARGVKSWTCLVVTPEMPGFTLGRIEDKLGQRASPAAELVFDDVFVPLRNRVGREGDGWRLNVLTLDTSRPAVGAIATGAARGIMRQLIAWAHEHNLSGDRLLQHDIGDMLARIEAARALVMRAAGTFPARHDLSAMAKSFASDTAMAVASQALDIMGEAGGLRQRCVERLYRDIKLTQIYEGTNQINRLGILEDILLKGLDWERW
jgi:butyryl-CoA dehydrogenase